MVSTNKIVDALTLAWGNSIRSQLYTKKYKQLKVAEHRKHEHSQGRGNQFVIQYQMHVNFLILSSHEVNTIRPDEMTRS